MAVFELSQNVRSKIRKLTIQMIFKGTMASENVIDHFQIFTSSGKHTAYSCQCQELEKIKAETNNIFLIVRKQAGAFDSIQNCDIWKAFFGQEFTTFV